MLGTQTCHANVDLKKARGRTLVKFRQKTQGGRCGMVNAHESAGFGALPRIRGSDNRS